MPRNQKKIVRSVRLTFGPGNYRTFGPGQEDAFEEGLDQLSADAEEAGEDFDKEALLHRLEAKGDIDGYADVDDEDREERNPQLAAMQKFEVEDGERSEESARAARASRRGGGRKTAKADNPSADNPEE